MIDNRTGYESEKATSSPTCKQLALMIPLEPLLLLFLFLFRSHLEPLPERAAAPLPALPDWLHFFLFPPVRPIWR